MATRKQAGVCNRCGGHGCFACDARCLPVDVAAACQAGEGLARWFHETYEGSAPYFGCETKQETRQFDPASPNGRLLMAVCNAFAARLREHAFRVAGGGPNGPDYDPETLDLELDAADALDAIASGAAAMSHNPTVGIYAERYRWLRVSIHKLPLAAFDVHDGSVLDHAIDTAIAKEKP